MPDQAYFNVMEIDRITGRISEWGGEVQYGPKLARIYISLKPPAASQTLEEELLAAELRELGAALVRMADTPKALFGPHPHRS